MGQKPKKGKWKWIIIAVVVVIVIAAIAGGGDSDKPKKTGEVTTETAKADDAGTEASAEDADEKEEPAAESVFHVGDVVETKTLRISFLSAAEYTTNNEFMQPKEGNVYYRMEFEFENIGDLDESISSLVSWNCYADGYAMNSVFIGDDDFSATISPGKKATGAIYYEVPADAKEITLEYETNAFTGEKAEFIVK